MKVKIRNVVKFNFALNVQFPNQINVKNVITIIHFYPQIMKHAANIQIVSDVQILVLNAKQNKIHLT